MPVEAFHPSDFPKIEVEFIYQVLGSRCQESFSWRDRWKLDSISVSDPLDPIYEPGIMYPAVLAYSAAPHSGNWYRISILEYYIGDLKISLPFEGTYALVIMDAAKPSVLLIERSGTELKFTCKRICILKY